MHYIWYGVGFLVVGALAFAVAGNHRSIATGIREIDGYRRLGDCPGTPNCVSSYRGSGYADLMPWEYGGADRDTAHEALMAVLMSRPRVRIVEERDEYIHSVFVSQLMRFRDDVEFYLPDDEPVIHFRAASRLGGGDLGVHERRMRELHSQFARELAPQ